MITTDIERYLFRRRLQIRTDLAVLLPDVADIEPASFFKTYVENGLEYGFSDPGCASNKHVLVPAPSEAEGRPAHLHIDERYAYVNGVIEPAFYRYEICWNYDLTKSITEDHDYFRDLLMTLRRGIRFDYHPHVSNTKDTHTSPHWHPNGCSELRMPTGHMTPLRVAIFAVRAFGSSQQKECLSKIPQLMNEVAELDKDRGLSL